MHRMRQTCRSHLSLSKSWCWKGHATRDKERGGKKKEGGWERRGREQGKCAATGSQLQWSPAALWATEAGCSSALTRNWVPALPLVLRKSPHSICKIRVLSSAISWIYSCENIVIRYLPGALSQAGPCAHGLTAEQTRHSLLLLLPSRTLCWVLWFLLSRNFRFRFYFFTKNKKE